MSDTRTVRWILTREADDARDEVMRLRARGIDARSVPCATYAQLRWPTWPNAPGQPLYFLTSPRAATAYVAHADATALVAASRPATEAVLRAGGVRITVASEGGALNLAHAVIAWWEARGHPTLHVRYPSSVQGMASKEQREALTVLLRVGPTVREPAYVTTPPDGLVSALAAAVNPPWSAAFAAPSAVAHFFDALPRGTPAPHSALCFGVSTAVRWNEKKPPMWPEAQLVVDATRTILALEDHR